MHPRIATQQQLMRSALATLNEIENANELFKDFDEDYLQDRKKTLQQQYANTMAELMAATVPQETFVEALPY